MNLHPLLVWFLLIVQSCCKVKDKEIEANGIKVKVLGKSGKVLVRKLNNENESVIILMDEISEYLADGTTKVSKHTFNTFANQEFIFTALKNKTYQSKLVI